MTDCPAYCIDSSSLLEAWVRSYPPKSFPSFWGRFELLVSEGRCVACEEVRTEVENDSTELGIWVKDHADFVIDFDWRQEQVVQQIMKEYPKIVNLKKNKGWADPFVIALAHCSGHTVVTEEGPGSIEGPKIPFICKKLGVRCINLLAMIEQEGWRF